MRLQSSILSNVKLKALATDVMRIPYRVWSRAIFISKYLAIADKVVVSNNGSIVFSGSPRELTAEILEKVYNAPIKKVSIASKEWILTVI